jgi:PEP-CTERM motif
MKKLVAAAALAASLSIPGVANASTIVNGGFEGSPTGTGVPTGWTSNNPALVQVVNSFGGYTPQQGSQFAVLSAGATNIATVLTQIFNMTAGETISFAVAFAAGDYLPFNDQGAFGIFNFTTFGGTTLFSQNVAGVGNYGQGPWTIVSFTAPTTGSYALNASVQNVGDAGLASYLLIDGAPAVPEPSTWMLMLLGFGAVGFAMRRRQKTQVRFQFA